MRRDDLTELHCIMPIANVRSVMQHGILSHQRAIRLDHESVADEAIQTLRKPVRVPGARFAHEYANLYFNARNAMMYVRRHRHRELCVLRVATDVLDVDGTLVTDMNLASDWALPTKPDDAGLARLDRDTIFAHSWNHPDELTKQKHKSRMMAEVLVPDRVPPAYISGAYVSCSDARAALARDAPNLPVVVRPYLFFQT
jgi:hypothetical protein